MDLNMNHRNSLSYNMTHSSSLSNHESKTFFKTILFLLFFMSASLVFASEQKPTGLLSATYKVDSSEYIAKKRIMGGTTVSLAQMETSDLNILIGDIYDLDGYTFSVEAFGGYFIKDALAVGLRAGYERTKAEIDFALLEDLVDLSQKRKYLSHGFLVEPYLRNYLKLFNTRHFYFFNETAFSVEYTSGISQTDDSAEMNKTISDAWTFQFGLRPGVNIFMVNGLAFETSISLLGLSSTLSTVNENDEKKSELNYNIINFKVNLLALNFSLVYFF